MNRVKAGDAWARVSTKRYGSRLDGNEARIEILSVSASLFLSLSRFLFVFPPSYLSASPFFVHNVSLDLSLRLSAVLWTLTVLSSRRLFHLITPTQYSNVRKRLDTRNYGNVGTISPFFFTIYNGVNKYNANAKCGIIQGRFLSSIIIRRATYNLIFLVSFVP